MAETTPKTIVYIARDLERALGPQAVAPSYFIITNSTPFAKQMAASHSNLFLIESAELLDTPQLLTHPSTVTFLETLVNPQLVVFKNLPIIEKICTDHGWTLLNPSANLAQTIEEKISQVEWLGSEAELLPPHEIIVLRDLTFTGTPFIIQFNRAHTGGGTILITSAEQLETLQTKFPDRPVRKTDYIEGTMITSNNLVFHDTIITGNPNVQITGLAPFTDMPFATIGNDWSLAQSLLSETQKNQYHDIVQRIGRKLQTSGWRGLFGTDIMLAKTGELYLIEINARQPASTTFESQLQAKIAPLTNTTFSLHLASLLQESGAESALAPVTAGAQIILRNQTKPITDACVTLFTERLKAGGFVITRYVNTEPGSDLVRIQSDSGVMDTPQTFNVIGQSIVQAFTCSL